jgi:hypothetical protein
MWLLLLTGTRLAMPPFCSGPAMADSRSVATVAADTEQLGSRCRPIGAPVPGATRLCRLGQRQRRRLAGLLEVRRDPGRGEPQARSRPGAEPHGAELSGVLVNPGAGPPEKPRDLDGVDEWLDPLGHQATQPGSEPIDEQVGESVERGIVVVGRLSVPA